MLASIELPNRAAKAPWRRTRRTRTTRISRPKTTRKGVVGMKLGMPAPVLLMSRKDMDPPSHRSLETPEGSLQCICLALSMHTGRLVNVSPTSRSDVEIQGVHSVGS